MSFRELYGLGLLGDGNFCCGCLLQSMTLSKLSSSTGINRLPFFLLRRLESKIELENQRLREIRGSSIFYARIIVTRHVIFYLSALASVVISLV